MTLEELQAFVVLWPIVSGLVTAAAAAGGAYAAIRVRLRYLERGCELLRGDVDRAHERIDALTFPNR